MDITKIKLDLTKELDNSKILLQEPMKKHTTFKVGGDADIYIKAQSQEDIKKIVFYAKTNDIPLTVIGNGSNILVKDKGIRGIVLEIAITNLTMEEQEDKCIATCGAGVSLTALAFESYDKSYTGLEFAYGIPGTVGGAVFMNAGAHGGQMQDVVVSTTYMDYDGNIKTIVNKEQEFEYRKSIFSKKNIGIILEVKLQLEHGDKMQIASKMEEYKNYRKEKQPISYPSAGSTFKRGEEYITAKLIDECGLKGYKIGDAQISTLHAGFIINLGNATAKDILDLIEYTKEKVYEKFKKKIELEIQILGE